MSNEASNTATEELDGPLRQAVEQICRSDVPGDRMEACLAGAIDAAGQPPKIRAATTSVARAPWVSRRRLLGLAAAAAVAALIVIQFGTAPVTLAQVANAVKGKRWIHVTERFDQQQRDVWFSPILDVSASRRDDWIAYHDHKLKVYHSYDVAEQVLYLVPEIGTRRQNHLADITETLPLLLADGSTPDDPLAKFHFLGGQRDDLTVVDQKMQRVTEGDRAWLDYTLTVKIDPIDQPAEVLFRVDPQTKLPHLNRVTATHEGRPVRYEASFDYPESGPEDIYAIGVPRDAKLVDRVPTGDVARLIAGVAAGRVRFDDFRAIVIVHQDGYESWWQEFPEIIHRKGNRIRRDLSYHRTSSATKPDDGVNVSEWWKKRAADFQYSPTRIGIGATDHVVRDRSITEADGTTRREIVSVQPYESGLPIEQWIPAFWSRTPDYVARPPLGVPNQHMEAVADTNPTEGPEGTVLLKVRRSGRVDSAPDPDADNRPAQPDEYRFWIDPAKEYLVMRMDMMGGDHETTYTVESVAQSPKGHWYPTRVRRKSSRPDSKDQILKFYVEFDVEIPDGLFDLDEPQFVDDVL